MHSLTGPIDHLQTGEQFLWFQRLGYVRVRDFVRVGTLIYVFLTSLITLVTSDLVTLIFVAVIAVVILRFASVDRYFSPRRRVTIYTDGELFIAKHVGSGAIRHGETLEDALKHLNTVVTGDRCEYETD